MTPLDIMYAPNQQVVRGDGSGGAEQGSGGSPPITDGTGGGDPGGVVDPVAPDDGLDAMTKDQLLAEAEARGITADASMTKDQIKAAIRGA